MDQLDFSFSEMKISNTTNSIITPVKMAEFDITNSDDYINGMEMYYKIGNKPYVYISTEFLIYKTDFLKEKDIKRMITIAKTNDYTPEYLTHHYYFKPDNNDNNDIINLIINNAVDNNQNILIQSKNIISDCIEYVINYLVKIYHMNYTDAYDILMAGKCYYNTNNIDHEISKLADKMSDMNI